jgi:hypothetical protein
MGGWVPTGEGCGHGPQVAYQNIGVGSNDLLTNIKQQQPHPEMIMIGHLEVMHPQVRIAGGGVEWRWGQRLEGELTAPVSQGRWSHQSHDCQIWEKRSCQTRMRMTARI